MTRIGVIIPAHNEEESIAGVIKEIPSSLVHEIVVVNNHSSDSTARIAKESGATVMDEKRKGYGWACLKGIEYFKSQRTAPEIIVFLDGDYSDYPEELALIVKPIIEEDYDLVIGSRTLGIKEKGSITPQQILGNWLATFLIRIFYHIHYTDLGPFRAIKFESLVALNMTDKTYGWTVEMQVKAAKKGYKCCEIPVNYRKRIGVSKVSGTLKGTIGAGFRILLTVFRYL